MLWPCEDPSRKVSSFKYWARVWLYFFNSKILLRRFPNTPHNNKLNYQSQLVHSESHPCNCRHVIQSTGLSTYCTSINKPRWWIGNKDTMVCSSPALLSGGVPLGLFSHSDTAHLILWCLGGLSVTFMTDRCKCVLGTTFKLYWCATCFIIHVFTGIVLIMFYVTIFCILCFCEFQLLRLQTIKIHE